MSEPLIPETSAEPSSPARGGQPVAVIGWLATLASVSMYFAYIDQIARNLDGAKGSFIQSAASFVAAALWTTMVPGEPNGTGR